MKTIFQRGTKLFDKFTMGHFFHLIVKRLNHFIKKAKSNIKKAKSLFDILLSDSGGYVSSVNAFLFSLKNKDNLKPFKAAVHVYRNGHTAFYHHSDYGPTFAGGPDLYISNNANLNTASNTYFGYAYQPPPG